MSGRRRPPGERDPAPRVEGAVIWVDARRPGDATYPTLLRAARSSESRSAVIDEPDTREPPLWPAAIELGGRVAGVRLGVDAVQRCFVVEVDTRRVLIPIDAAGAVLSTAQRLVAGEPSIAAAGE